MENKKRESRFELRINGETKRQAMERAREKGCSLAELINMLIEKHLSNKSRVKA